MNCEPVILVHGLAAPRLLLWPLARRLSANGYWAKTWGYHSLSGPLQSHVAGLREDYRRMVDAAGASQVHLIGHSMGAIMIRWWLDQQVPDRLGRVILIAPPNRGSPIANRLTDCGLKLPSLRQLRADPSSFVCRLADPPESVQIGVLAASRDRVVPLDNTPLEHLTDYRVVRAGHTTILFRQLVAQYCARFLRYGSFRGTVTSASRMANRFPPAKTEVS